MFTIVRRILLAVILYFGSFTLSHAQDPHYAQFFNCPLYENPANAGFFNGTYRISLNYRNQWRSVSKPFTTAAAALDAPLFGRILHHDKIGIGGMVLRDKAGDSEYGITAGILGLSYHKALNRRGNNYLLFGIQYFLAQRTIDYTALRFGDQFNGNNFDPALQTSEQFSKDQYAISDLNLGIKWHFHPINGIQYETGLSVSHLLEPNQSLYDVIKIPIKKKYTATCKSTIPFKNRFEAIPALYLSRQGKFNELIFGGLLNIKQDEKNALPLDFSGGLFNRWNDAVIIMVGASYKLYTFGLSYDLNYSGLRKSSDYRGGPEISVSINLGRERNLIKKEVSCPIF